MSEYNGWTNYETWNVALWIDNDRGTYEMIQEWAQEAWKEAGEWEYRHGSNNPTAWLTNKERATKILADQIQELVEDGNPIGSDASMYTDLLNGALSEVNWSEIAEGRIEEVEKEEEVTP